jgi:hypothetical protein
MLSANNATTLVLHALVEMLQIIVKLVRTRRRHPELFSEIIHALAKMDSIMWAQIRFVVFAIILVQHVLGETQIQTVSAVQLIRQQINSTEIL